MAEDRASPHVRHEAEHFREGNRRFSERADREVLIDPHDQHAVWANETLKLPIQSLSHKDVELKADVARFAGRAEAKELQDLLYELREINERFVGEDQLAAFVEINGSAEQRELIERSMAWARAYVPRRLARPSTRDQGCVYRRFLRLWTELVTFVDQIGLTVTSSGAPESASVLGQYIAPMCDYISWSFFEGTWASDVSWSDQGRPTIRPRPDVDLLVRAQCLHAFGVYQWKKAKAYDLLLSAMGSALAAAGARVEPVEDERARIELLAEDIAEMRPFLVRNFPRSKAHVALPGGMIAGFSWDSLDQIGRLHVAQDERVLLEAEAKGVADLTLSIGAQGYLRCAVRSWRSVANCDLELPYPAISIGRIGLEAVHAKLFSFYERVDVEAILSRWRYSEVSDGPQVVGEAAPSESMVIAASILTGSGVIEEGRRHARVGSSLRLSALRAVLERSFGCEARSSKGSELTFYRPGGRHAWVARHVSNPLIPAVAIQRMLRKLGISVAEWVEATAR